MGNLLLTKIVYWVTKKHPAHEEAGCKMCKVSTLRFRVKSYHEDRSYIVRQMLERLLTGFQNGHVGARLIQLS